MTNSPAVVVELLPCPFCGNSGPTKIGYWTDLCGFNYRVRCVCGAAIGGGSDEAADIDCWNTRASTHAEPAEPVDGDAVERVARAIFNTTEEWTQSNGIWSALPEYGQDVFRDRARAAIAALPDIATLTAQLDAMKVAGKVLP
jgi:hypothetical protein